MSMQNVRENIEDRLKRGVISIAQANVEMIRAERFRIITNGVPKEVRIALNEAVKNGQLAHRVKSDINPEAYYHPGFEYLLKAEFKRRLEMKLSALTAVLSHAGSESGEEE